MQVFWKIADVKKKAKYIIDWEFHSALNSILISRTLKTWNLLRAANWQISKVIDSYLNELIC